MTTVAAVRARALATWRVPRASRARAIASPRARLLHPLDAVQSFITHLFTTFRRFHPSPHRPRASLARVPSRAQTFQKGTEPRPAEFRAPPARSTCSRSRARRRDAREASHRRPRAPTTPTTPTTRPGTPMMERARAIPRSRRTPSCPRPSRERWNRRVSPPSIPSARLCPRRRRSPTPRTPRRRSRRRAW